MVTESSSQVQLFILINLFKWQINYIWWFNFLRDEAVIEKFQYIILDKNSFFKLFIKLKYYTNNLFDFFWELINNEITIINLWRNNTPHFATIKRRRLVAEPTRLMVDVARAFICFLFAAHSRQYSTHSSESKVLCSTHTTHFFSFLFFFSSLSFNRNWFSGAFVYDFAHLNLTLKV